MFGREEPLRVLEAGLAHAAGGQPQIALVAGEAGVGKTRLLQALERTARSRGFLVLHGESVEFGGEELPFAPLAAALRRLPEDWLPEAVADMPAEARSALAVLLPWAALGADPPTGAQAPGALGQGLLYESLLELLGRLARTRARSSSRSRTCTGRTGRPSAASPSWRATCARKPSPSP